MNTFAENLTKWWKLIATVVATIAAVVVWHYTQFETVAAAEVHKEATDAQWASTQDSIDTQTLVLLKRELREFQRELASLPPDTPADDKMRVWLEDQIAELQDEINKIEASKRST